MPQPNTENTIIPGKSVEEDHKVSLLMAQDLYTALQDIANEQGTTILQVIIKAIALEVWIQGEKKNGNTFLCGQNGKYREVIDL